MALPGFCDWLERKLSKSEHASPDFIGEVGVGSVDLMGIIPAADTDYAAPAFFDLGLVKVRWQGWRFAATPGDRPVRKSRSTVETSILVLARKTAAKTNPDLSISSAHCPACGSPEIGGAASSCQHCGTALNDGEQQWALAEWLPQGSERLRALQERLKVEQQWPAGDAASVEGSANVATGSLQVWAPSTAAGMLQWMVRMAVADGEISPQEDEQLRAVASRYGIPEATLQQYIAAAKDGSMAIEWPSDPGVAKAQIRELARVALADGKLTDDELQLLRVAAERLGLSEYDLNHLLRHTRRELFTAARSFLRENRGKR